MNTVKFLSRGGGRITCFRCGGPNHKANSCCATDEEVEQYQAFLSVQARDTMDEAWYKDTGPNQHKASKTIEAYGTWPCIGTDTIIVGNSSSLPISDLTLCSNIFTHISYGCVGSKLHFFLWCFYILFSYCWLIFSLSLAISNGLQIRYYPYTSSLLKNVGHLISNSSENHSK